MGRLRILACLPYGSITSFLPGHKVEKVTQDLVCGHILQTTHRDLHDGTVFWGYARAILSSEGIEVFWGCDGGGE